jgi:hypothetical protein
MKLKLMILSALFVAGIFASLALADGGKHAQQATSCHEVHISGTIAPQTLAVTVDKASDKSLIAAGTQLSLAVGSTGQTVRVNAGACSTGTGSALVLTVKQVDLQVKTAQTTTTQTGTTQTGTTGTTTKHGDEHGNEHHKGGTTTTATTIATTTTTGTTTTTP